MVINLGNLPPRHNSKYILGLFTEEIDLVLRPHFNVYFLKGWVTASSISKTLFFFGYCYPVTTFPTKQDSFQRHLMPLDSSTFVKLLHAVEQQYCVVSVPDLLLLINAYWVSTLTFHVRIISQLILTI